MARDSFPVDESDSCCAIGPGAFGFSVFNDNSPLLLEPLKLHFQVLKGLQGRGQFLL